MMKKYHFHLTTKCFSHTEIKRVIRIKKPNPIFVLKFETSNFSNLNSKCCYFQILRKVTLVISKDHGLYFHFSTDSK